MAEKTQHDSYPCEVIGHVESPFKEKFGIPRQPGLVAAEGNLRMLPPYDDPVMFEGLDGFSHIWLTFVFHANRAQGWQPRVRPPRLGGNARVGVFASRAPFRPNHLGLSVVELLAIDNRDGVRLRLRGLDLLDGTPVLDIKPYVPYTDGIEGAVGGFAPAAPEARLAVAFTAEAEAQLAGRSQLRALIVETLSLDPRPAYHADDPGRVYGVRLVDVDVRWRVVAGRIEVMGLPPTR